MMTETLLHIQNLSRSFGEFQAVKPLDLDLYENEITLLTGPNGAGKSTLLLCLSGLLRPTKGQVFIQGYELYEQECQAKKRLAFVPDVPHFYPGLTALEHLRFISLAYGVEDGWENRARAILAEFGLWENRNLYPHNLSRGMRLKLGITLALSRPFKVLLMDEPTSALDSESAKVLVDQLTALRDAGCAILLASHDLSLVESLANRHLRMDLGRVEAV